MRGVEAGEKMKFNLKNRPIHKGYAGTTREFIVDQEKWFEAFEKELRELLGVHYEDSDDLIKEILGE